MPVSRYQRTDSRHKRTDLLSRERIDRLRLRAMIDYGRGKLDETLAKSAGQAGRIYRAALNKLEDQVEAHEKQIAAATTAKSGGKLTAGTTLAILTTLATQEGS